MDLTPAANEFLGATEDRLGQVLTRAGGGVAASDTLSNAARHLCIGGGGKRLRPLMVHLFGRAVGASPASLLHVGVAAELVHSAWGDLCLPPERLRAIAEGKTGALFGFCGGAAATLAGKPEVARRFDTFGRHLGVAFQIADDLKDLTGGDPGKPPFADIRSRTPSLPLLFAAAADAEVRRCLKDLWAFGSMPDERVREVGQAVLASPAMGEARAELHREISRALDALGAYAQEPGGEQLVAWTQALGQAFEEGIQA
jgi:geranylgeranyl pyrophosphate synthase